MIPRRRCPDELESAMTSKGTWAAFLFDVHRSVTGTAGCSAMDDDQRALRRAQIAELLLALQEAFQKLDQLEKRIAERKLLDSTSPANRETNPIASRIAIGMTKGAR
jgi:hypothetical protein